MCWKLFILWEGQKEKFLKYINANIVHIRDKGSGIFDHRIMTERLLLNFFVKSVVQQTVSDMEVRAKVCLSGVTFRSIILWYHVMLQFDLIHFKGCLEYNEVRFLFLFGVLFLKVHYWFLSCCHPLVCCCIYPALHQIS